MRIVDLKLDKVKKAKYPKQVRELEKLVDQVVYIAQSSAQKDIIKVLTQKMDVDEVLDHVGSLSDTANKVLNIEPFNIKAKTKKTIADAILNKISTKETLSAIKEVEKIAELKGGKVPIELQLFKVNELLKTGKKSDIDSAKDTVDILIPLIQSKNIKGEDIFNDLGVSKSSLAKTFEIISTDSGPKVMHEGEEVTDKRVISNAIIGLDKKEKLIVYANYPTEYIQASTYDAGWQLVDKVVYLFDGGNIYLYEFIGENKQIVGLEEEHIRNAVFYKKVNGGIEIPLPQRFLPQELPLKTSPIQKAKNFFDRFFFLQVHVPPPYFAEGTYSYTSCNFDNQCNWPSTCHNGICCSIRDDGSCEIPRRINKENI